MLVCLFIQLTIIHIALKLPPVNVYVPSVNNEFAKDVPNM